MIRCMHIFLQGNEFVKKRKAFLNLGWCLPGEEERLIQVVLDVHLRVPVGCNVQEWARELVVDCNHLQKKGLIVYQFCIHAIKLLHLR